MSAGDDEGVDVRGGELLQEPRHVVVDPVAREAPVGEEGVVVGEAADVDGDLDPLVEGGQPLGHGAAHRHAERRQARGVDVAAAEQPVDGPDRVVDHHSPQDPALPEHRLEGVELRGRAALAEAPVVDREDDVPLLDQGLRVGDRVQVGAAVDELLLADVVAPAVGVVEDDGWARAARSDRASEERGHGLEPVQVEHPRLEDVAAPLLLAALRGADRPLPVGQVAEQLVQAGAPRLRVAVRPAGRGRDRHRGRRRGREGRAEARPRRLQELPPLDLAHAALPGRPGVSQARATERNTAA